MTALEDFIAARAAIAAEQADVDAKRAAIPNPTLSDRAKSILAAGHGLNGLIVDGECQGCARAVFERETAKWAHNRAMKALADAKREAGFDEALDAAQRAMAALGEAVLQEKDAQARSALVSLHDQYKAELGSFGYTHDGMWLGTREPVELPAAPEPEEDEGVEAPVEAEEPAPADILDAVSGSQPEDSEAPVVDLSDLESDVGVEALPPSDEPVADPE